MKNKLQYNGNHLFKNINFGLYYYEDIDFEKTKEAILTAFKNQYKDKIKKRLKAVGLKLEGFDYFSPKEYNFSTDSIDLIISVKDIDLLKKNIQANKQKIDTALNKNKSYNGYIALTVSNIDEEIDRIECVDKKGEAINYEPDIIVVRELLDLDCSNFLIEDYL